MDIDIYAHIEVSDAEIEKIMQIHKGGTEAQIANAIHELKRAKAGALAMCEYVKKVKSPPIAPIYTDAEYTKIMESRLLSMVPGFAFREDNKYIFQQMCIYFNKGNKALIGKRGLMLVGPVGCGKTTLMKLFKENPLQSYSVISCRKISYDYAKDGIEIIERYSKMRTGAPDLFLHSDFGIALDDLGTDDERRHYGDKLNALTEVLLNRYEDCPHNATHITTNMKAKQIKDYYGERVYSRIREMFHILTFDLDSPDYRMRDK